MSAIVRFTYVEGIVRCCGAVCGNEEQPFCVPFTTDAEELEDLACEDAGFDEMGLCPACSLENAREEQADRERQEGLI